MCYFKNATCNLVYDQKLCLSGNQDIEGKGPTLSVRGSRVVPVEMCRAWFSRLCVLEPFINGAV